MYFVYALKSRDRNYIYVGISNDPAKRLRQHNNGYEKTTKPYRPFTVFLTELFSSRPLARKREIFLKSGAGKEFLKRLLRDMVRGLPAGPAA